MANLTAARPTRKYEHDPRNRFQYITLIAAELALDHRWTAPASFRLDRALMAWECCTGVAR